MQGEFLYDAVTQKRFFAKGVDYNPRPCALVGVLELPGENRLEQTWQGGGRLANWRLTGEFFRDDSR